MDDMQFMDSIFIFIVKLAIVNEAADITAAAQDAQRWDEAGSRDCEI